MAGEIAVTEFLITLVAAIGIGMVVVVAIAFLVEAFNMISNR